MINISGRFDFIDQETRRLLLAKKATSGLMRWLQNRPRDFWWRTTLDPKKPDGVYLACTWNSKVESWRQIGGKICKGPNPYDIRKARSEIAINQAKNRFETEEGLAKKSKRPYGLHEK